jgi:hypothetical protein
MNLRLNGSLTFDDSLQGAMSVKLTATTMLTVDGTHLDPEGTKLRGPSTIDAPGATLLRLEAVKV